MRSQTNYYQVGVSTCKGHFSPIKWHDFFLPECPTQLLLRCPTWSDVNSKEKLSEVNVAVSIRVEGPEDVVAEVPGIATREALAVDLDKGGWSEFSVGAVRDETPVPLLQIVQEVKSWGFCLRTTWIVSSSYFVFAFRKFTSSFVRRSALELPWPMIHYYYCHFLLKTTPYITPGKRRAREEGGLQGSPLSGTERCLQLRLQGSHLLSPCPAFWQHCTATLQNTQKNRWPEDSLL